MKKITKLFVAAYSVLAIAGLSAQTADAQNKITLNSEWSEAANNQLVANWSNQNDKVISVGGNDEVTITTTVPGTYFEGWAFDYAAKEFYLKTLNTLFTKVVIDSTATEHYISTSGYVEVNGERYLEADWQNTSFSKSSYGETDCEDVGTTFKYLKYKNMDKAATYTIVMNYKFVGVDSIGFRRQVKYNSSASLTNKTTAQQIVVNGNTTISNIDEEDSKTYYVIYGYTKTFPYIEFSVSAYDYNTRKRGAVENITTDQQLNGYPSVFLYDVNTKKFVPVTTRNTSSSTPYAAVDADKNILTEDYPCLNDYGYYFTEAQPTSVEGVYDISFMPVDPTHTYIACVASRTAGYDMLVFTFDKNIETYHVRHSQFQSVVPMETDVDVTSVVKGLTRIRSSLYINASDVVTGIEDVDAEDASVEAVYYDLSGRSSSKPFSGVNIVKRGAQVTKELH